MNNARQIELNGSGTILSLVFLEDGKHLLSGEDGMIRQWCADDSTEVGEPIIASSCVRSIALSGDRQWIVSSEGDWATVWNRASRQRVLTVKEHTALVRTVDVSPDSTRFATGSEDKRVFIWDILTGRRIFGPLEHEQTVPAVKFSPDGDCIATTTWGCDALRIYNALTGQLLRELPVASIQTNIAWSSDSQRIFTLSSDGVIRQIFVDTGTFLSQWKIPNGQSISGSLVLPSNGRFIASAIGRSLTLWDTSAREQFGPIFNHPSDLVCIALSSDNNYLATGGDSGIITLRNLNNIIPMYYLGGQRVFQQPQPGSGGDTQRQIEALRRDVDEMKRTIAQSIIRPQAQALPGRILNNIYRIKSIVADVYLTCPQGDEDSIVVAQQLQLNSNSQRWSISHVGDGAYSIVGRKGSSDVPLGIGSSNELVCVPDGKHVMWTIDTRGSAYMIGNAVDATAIHITQSLQCVTVSLRDGSQNQRWVLECTVPINEH